MSAPLLTIIVPTYNRSANLEILLKTLHRETAPVGNNVVVHVYDNCSPDNTPSIVASIQEDWPALQSYRHDVNLGPDGNFSHAVSKVSTRWFWIIGDDDLPKSGVIAKVVSLIQEKNPALLYMRSEWIKPVLHADQGEPVTDLDVLELNALAFAEILHVWVTFISGMIIEKDRLPVEFNDKYMNEFSGTNLIQLAWILPLLRSNGPFVIVNNQCILATKENSGGYGLLSVFGVNFASIVKKVLGENSDVANVLIKGNVFSFMPGLVWDTRKSSSSFKKEDPWQGMHRELGGYVTFWLFLVPIRKLPYFLAGAIFQFWRVVNKLVSLVGSLKRISLF